MGIKLKTKDIEPDDLSEDEVHHMSVYGDYYQTKILNYKKHWRMVQNIGMYAEQAGIPEYFIYNTSEGILLPKDIDYLEKFGVHAEKGISGAVIPTHDTNFIDRMYSMVGVLTRNFIEARFITLQDLIKEIKAGNPPKSKLICIPNFALDKSEGGNVATWEMSNVLSWVLNSHSQGRQLVVYVESYDYIRQQYGGVLWTHIDNHFLELE